MLTIFLFQWFNLNSLLTGPELISDTYLALFLAQLQQEGALKCSWIHSTFWPSEIYIILRDYFVQVTPYL